MTIKNHINNNHAASIWIVMQQAVLILALFLLQGCSSAQQSSTSTITLGALLNMSSTGDPDTQAAVQLAMEDVNAWFAAQETSAGAATRLRIEIEATGLDAAVALSKVQLLAARGIKVLIGPESSAEVEAIKPFTDASNMLVLSHCSTAPSLALANDSVLRLVPSDLRQATAIAHTLATHNIANIVPLWRAGIWGDDLAAAIAQEFKARGGVVQEGVRFDPEAPDQGAILDTLQAQLEHAQTQDGKTAVVFLGFGPEGAVLLRQAAELPELSAVPWFASDGTALSREITDDANAAAFAVKTGFISTLFAEANTTQAQQVRARISAATGGAVHYCATAAYDAVWLAALAAAQAGTADITSFRRTLEQLAASHAGATGNTSLDANGDRATAEYDLWQIVEAAGEFVWQRAVPAQIGL